MVPAKNKPEKKGAAPGDRGKGGAGRQGPQGRGLAGAVMAAEDALMALADELLVRGGGESRGAGVEMREPKVCTLACCAMRYAVRPPTP